MSSVDGLVQVWNSFIYNFYNIILYILHVKLYLFVFEVFIYNHYILVINILYQAVSVSVHHEAITGTSEAQVVQNYTATLNDNLPSNQQVGRTTNRVKRGRGREGEREGREERR